MGNFDISLQHLPDGRRVLCIVEKHFVVNEVYRGVNIFVSAVVIVRLEQE